MKHLIKFEKFVEPSKRIYDKLEQLIDKLLMEYKGGKEFFDALDDTIKDSINKDIIIELMRGKENEWVCTSGGFGDRLYELYEKGEVNCKGMLVFNGRILTKKKKVTYWYPSDFDIHNKEFTYIDDSLFSGSTWKKINEFLMVYDSSIKDINVVYDGSKEKNPIVHSFYRYYDMINEGLTKTIPFNVVKKKMIEYGVGKDEIFIMGKDRGTELIKIFVKANKRKGFYNDMIKRMENLFGWFLLGYLEDFEPVDTNIEQVKKYLEYNIEMIKQEYPEETNLDIGTLVFEPKFSQKESIPRTLYHITDKKVLNKIEKQGLVPRSMRKLTYHPDRIYFLKNKRDAKSLLDHKDFAIDEPVLLTIDTKGLDIKLMKDPNMLDAVYTQDNIPPKNIIAKNLI